MGGDILYFLHRHFRAVFFSSVIASVAGFVMLVATVAKAAHLV